MSHLTTADMLGTPAVLELKDEERQPCEIWTRVMGYHRPVSSFNQGKQGEFADRVAFREHSRTVD
ncbi:hypothetical protein F1188_15575 [Roseospira marina]|uniref:Uncharacterized protein n=1 Tax=Roseospira marina TaxID=140057 RepID=A0A5M6I8F3_9PROT|nr:anaerobic ribonucleoside-triphosphate reductase [Roseospira marina]KAA5604463.1 hypothetical protein F1188_15575 [Roseospira marina]MBB4315509.1 hypothetical protein [Roseospira marina]MBB5088554.1 hypothetical protein [Roseospira marina]